jgi:hypothetical protein
VPTYRLAPVDPTDSIWLSSAFATSVTIDAPDEETARRQVAAQALATMRRSMRRQVAHLPWLFPSFTSCVIATEG